MFNPDTLLSLPRVTAILPSTGGHRLEISGQRSPEYLPSRAALILAELPTGDAVLSTEQDAYFIPCACLPQVRQGLRRSAAPVLKGA